MRNNEERILRLEERMLKLENILLNIEDEFQKVMRANEILDEEIDNCALSFKELEKNMNESYEGICKVLNQKEDLV